MKKLLTSLGLAVLLPLASSAAGPPPVLRNDFTTNANGAGYSSISTHLTNPVFQGMITGNGSGLTNMQGSGITPQTRLVFEGDSYSESGTWSTALTNIFPFWRNVGEWINVAVGGETLYQVTNEYATEVYPRRPASGTNAVLFIWAGANDLANGTNASVLISEWSNYVWTAKNDGYRVCSFTIIPSRWIISTEAYAAARWTFNNYIRMSSLSDWVVDVATKFQDPYNTDWFNVDGVHLNAAGYSNLAYEVNSVLQTPMSSQREPVVISQSASNVVIREVATGQLIAKYYTNGNFFVPGGYTCNAGIAVGTTLYHGHGYGISDASIDATGPRLIQGPVSTLYRAGYNLTGAGGVGSPSNSLWISGQLVVSNGARIIGFYSTNRPLVSLEPNPGLATNFWQTLSTNGSLSSYLDSNGVFTVNNDIKQPATITNCPITATWVTTNFNGSNTFYGLITVPTGLGTVSITNNYVTTNTAAFVTVNSIDTTAFYGRALCSANLLTIVLNAAPTTNCLVSWLIRN